MSKLNKYDLSHEKRFSCNQGYLIPTMVIDALPGEVFKWKSENFTRLAPMIAPPMQRIDIRTYNFAVPYRLVWDDAEEFFTRGRNQDSTVTVPRIGITEANRANFITGNLADFFSVPPTDYTYDSVGDIVAVGTIDGTHWTSALRFRAYQLIWNEYFRNQETQAEIPIDKSSADDLITTPDGQKLVSLRLRNHDKDYFTSGKLSANLNAELNGYARIEPMEDGTGTGIYKIVANAVRGDGSGSAWPNTGAENMTMTKNGLPEAPIGDSTAYGVGIQNLQDPLGVSISEIQRVSKMRQWMMKLINGGYRYVDYLLSMWSVRSSDARFQRPEFLGGSTQPIRISEVLNTSDTANAPQGEMAGHGVSAGSSDWITYKTEEHCIIMQLTVIVPKASYFQGINPFMRKFDHLDFANPMLADLGPQETPSSEIWYNYTDTQAENDVNFCYKNRYAEYKSIEDSVHGDFRFTLNYWLMARKFGTRPILADIMSIELNQDIFAVESGHHFFMDIIHNVNAWRPLPYFPNLQID